MSRSTASSSRAVALVDEGEAVVGQDDVEDVGCDVAAQQVDVVASDPEVLGDTRGSEFDESVQGAAGPDGLVERHPFRIVKVQELDAVHAEPLEAFLD